MGNFFPHIWYRGNAKHLWPSFSLTLQHNLSYAGARYDNQLGAAPNGARAKRWVVVCWLVRFPPCGAANNLAPLFVCRLLFPPCAAAGYLY